MTMGEKIMSMRKARLWSQEELADRVGVTRQAVSRWEADSAKPDADNILALCDLFGVSSDYLLREQYTGEGTQPIQMEKQETALRKFFRGLTLKQWAWTGALTFACLVLLGLRILYLLSDSNYGYVINGLEYTGYAAFLRHKDIMNIWYLAFGGALLSVIMLCGNKIKDWFLKNYPMEP